MAEFDAERGELFLSRAAVLVEGRTEKLVLPFIFRALGHDPDRQSISIVDCGGKSNVPLFAKVSRAVGVPFVAVYDRDAEPGERPLRYDAVLNRQIRDLAGRGRWVELARDFESVAGLRGSSHKPARAFKRFTEANAESVPQQLARVVDVAISIARD